MNPFDGLNRFLFRKFFWSRYGNHYFSIIASFAITGFVLGVCALVVVMSIMKGFQHQIKHKLQNISPNFLVTLDHKPSKRLLDKVEAMMAQTGNWAMVFVPMKAFLKDSPLGETILDFRVVHPDYYKYLEPFLRPSLKKPVVAIGKEAGYRLFVSKGSQITVSLPGVYEDPLQIVPKELQLSVESVVQTGVYSIDGYSLFVPHTLFSLDEVPAHWRHEIYLFGDFSNDNVAWFRSLPGVVAVRSWEEQNRLLYFALWLESATMNTFLGLILLVALTSIVSLLYIFFSDRRQTLGVLLSLGLSPKRIKGLLTSFGVMIGFIGTIAGLALSVLVLLYVQGSDQFQLPQIYYHRKFPVHVDIGFVCWVALGSLFSSVVVSFLVSRRLLRQRLLDHLSHDPVV